MSQIGQVIGKKSLKISGVWLPTFFVLSTGSILVVMIFAALAYQVVYLDRIYPGVTVGGTSVAGMTPTEAMVALHEQSAEYLSRPITIQFVGESRVFTGQELGMWIDVRATADKAYAVGRQGNIFVDMLMHLKLIAAPYNMEPVIRYDTGPTNQISQRLAGKFDYPPQDAQLIIHPDSSIEFIPAQRGRRVHIQATGAAIEKALFSNDDQPVIAVIQEVIPAITDADVATAHQQAENLLGQSLIFGFNADTDAAEWRIEPQTLVDLIDFVEVTNTEGRTQLELEFKREKFGAYFEEFARAIDIEASDARLEFDPETKELTVLQESRDGRALDVETAYQKLEALADDLKEKPVHFVELPLILTPAVVSSKDIEGFGINELVSESTSYFKGSSQGRMHNIALSASKFHGIVIPPGEIFSFNEYLGEVSKEAGYDESLIIFGDRTTVGIGGGVCQVSTTAFRTAFFGGFELVERWAHGYRVSWYETNSAPGLDATIYSPEVDLRFRNDTDHYLLIQTNTDLEAGTLTFQFYGTRPEREVIISQPKLENIVKHGPPVYEEDPTLRPGAVKQVDWAVDGMDVTVTRTVKEGDLVLHEDVITSHYRPWRAVYKVGPLPIRRPVGG